MSAPLKSPAVLAWCQSLWDARKAETLAEAGVLSRGLANAVAADVAAHRNYDPEMDQRVHWAREIIRQHRIRPQFTPRASGDSEAVAAWLLDRMPTPTGRALACVDG